MGNWPHFSAAALRVRESAPQWTCLRRVFQVGSYVGFPLATFGGLGLDGLAPAIFGGTLTGLCVMGNVQSKVVPGAGSGWTIPGWVARH
jgi:hypothetical protein